MDIRDIRAFTPVFGGLCPGMTEQGAASMRNRAGNFPVGRLMEFLTALGQDVRITVKPTKKRQGEMEAGWGDGRAVAGLDAASSIPDFASLIRATLDNGLTA